MMPQVQSGAPIGLGAGPNVIKRATTMRSMALDPNAVPKSVEPPQ